MKTEKNNPAIRQRMKENKLPFWQVAEGIGISEGTLYRWFRHDLTPAQEAAVDGAISRIISVRG